MRLTNLTTRQKLLSIILVIVLILLVWQLMGLREDKLLANSPTPPAATSLPTRANAPPPQAAPPATATIVTNDPYQQEYLHLLQQYKMAELKKMIAEDQQAIATANAATAKAVNDSAKYGGTTADNNDDIFSGSSATKNNNANYTLIYTGQQDGEWTATLKRGNQTYDIMVGTLLDGDKRVTQINNDGVIIQNKQQVWHIGFDNTEAEPIQAKALPTSVTSYVPSMPSTPPALPASATTNKTTEPSNIVQVPPLPKTTEKVALINANEMHSTEKSDHKKEITLYKDSSNNTSIIKKAVSWCENMWQKIHSPNQNQAKASPYFFDQASPSATTKNNNSTNVIVPITASKNPTISPPHQIPSLNTPTEEEHDILSAPSTQFTIQLATASTQQQLTSFLNDSSMNTQIYRSLNSNNIVQYSIIYGLYKTRDDAEIALLQLDPSLRKRDAYVVSISTIQNSLQTFLKNNTVNNH